MLDVLDDLRENSLQNNTFIKEENKELLSKFLVKNHSLLNFYVNVAADFVVGRTRCKSR